MRRPLLCRIGIHLGLKCHNVTWWGTYTTCNKCFEVIS